MATLLLNGILGSYTDEEMKDNYAQLFASFETLRGKENEEIPITRQHGDYSDQVYNILVDPLYPDYPSWVEWTKDYEKVLAMVKVVWDCVVQPQSDAGNAILGKFTRATLMHRYMELVMSNLGLYQEMGFDLYELQKAQDTPQIDRRREVIAHQMCDNPAARSKRFWVNLRQFFGNTLHANYEMLLLSSITLPSILRSRPNIYFFLWKVFGRTLGSQLVQYIENLLPAADELIVARKIAKKTVEISVDKIPEPIPERFVPIVLLLDLRVNHYAARFEYGGRLAEEGEAQLEWEMQFDHAVAAVCNYRPFIPYDDLKASTAKYFTPLWTLATADVARLFTDPAWGQEPLKVFIQEMSTGRKIEWIGGPTLKPLWVQLCDVPSLAHEENEITGGLFDELFEGAYEEMKRNVIDPMTKRSYVSRIIRNWQVAGGQVAGGQGGQ